MAFSAIAAEIAAAEPEPFLIMRTLRLNPRHVEQLTAALHDLADEKNDADDDPRYGLLLGLYQHGQPPGPGP